MLNGGVSGDQQAMDGGRGLSRRRRRRLRLDRAAGSRLVPLWHHVSGRRSMGAKAGMRRSFRLNIRRGNGPIWRQLLIGLVRGVPSASQMGLPSRSSSGESAGRSCFSYGSRGTKADAAQGGTVTGATAKLFTDSGRGQQAHELKARPQSQRRSKHRGGLLIRFVSSMLTALLVTTTSVSTSSAIELPEPGTRIRVTAHVPERERWVGHLVSVARDTITFHDAERNGALVKVPTLQVSRFEISRGTGAGGLRGAGKGFAAGALFGAVVGYASHGGDDNLVVSSSGESAAAGAIFFGVLGATAGSLIHSEHWRALGLEDLRGTARP